MKTTISMSSSSIHASIGPDVKCRARMPPKTDIIGPQIPGSPPFQISQIMLREMDTPALPSPKPERTKERSLESPVVQRSLPNSRSCADQSPHKALQVLLGGFLISKEPLGPALHPGGFVLGQSDSLTHGIPKETGMDGCPGWFQDGLSPG